MNKTKKLLALLLAAMMLFALTACEVSSSSTTTVTTTTTDSSGNTTTNTTTTTVGTGGVSSETTAETTTTEPAAEAEGEELSLEERADRLADHLLATYSIGAEGENEDGERIYYAWNDDDDDAEEALLIIISPDGEHYSGYEGVTETVDDHVELYDADRDAAVPYTFSEVDTDDNFTMTFLGDGDVVEMHIVDLETIVDDIVAVWSDFQ